MNSDHDTTPDNPIVAAIEEAEEMKDEAIMDCQTNKPRLLIENSDCAATIKVRDQRQSG